MLGAAIIFSIPLSIAAFFGAIASAVLLAISAPPITYLFILFAALMSFRGAVKHPGYGMEGCVKMFGLVASGYAIIWTIVSFDATGGLRSFEADAVSLRWLQPPLAALPFALLVMRLAGKAKRTAWFFIGSMVFVSAWMALIFFPVENGFASRILPANDWLRFPIAALAVAAVLTLVRLFFVLRAKPNVRRSRLRDLKTNSRIYALIMVAFGFAWAAARTVIRLAV